MAYIKCSPMAEEYPGLDAITFNIYIDGYCANSRTNVSGTNYYTFKITDDGKTISFTRNMQQSKRGSKNTTRTSGYYNNFRFTANSSVPYTIIITGRIQLLTYIYANNNIYQYLDFTATFSNNAGTLKINNSTGVNIPSASSQATYPEYSIGKLENVSFTISK